MPVFFSYCLHYPDKNIKLGVWGLISIVFHSFFSGIYETLNDGTSHARTQCHGRKTCARGENDEYKSNSFSLTAMRYHLPHPHFYPGIQKLVIEIARLKSKYYTSHLQNIHPEPNDLLFWKAKTCPYDRFQ